MHRSCSRGVPPTSGPHRRGGGGRCDAVAAASLASPSRRVGTSSELYRVLAPASSDTRARTSRPPAAVRSLSMWCHGSTRGGPWTLATIAGRVRPRQVSQTARGTGGKWPLSMRTCSVARDDEVQVRGAPGPSAARACLRLRAARSLFHCRPPWQRVPRPLRFCRGGAVKKLLRLGRSTRRDPICACLGPWCRRVGFEWLITTELPIARHHAIHRTRRTLDDLVCVIASTKRAQLRMRADEHKIFVRWHSISTGSSNQIGLTIFLFLVKMLKTLLPQ
jgi:hypothetical protein